jgi:hypothetical protein
MKTIQRTAGVLTLITMVGAAALITGCATGGSSGYKQADKTGAGIAAYRDEIVNGKKAIDATMKSLGDIAATANTDPRKAYEQYKKDVANLESTAAKIRSRAQAMQASGQAYFAQWQQELSQVSNPDVRELAEKRKAKLQEAFDTIAETAKPLKEQFDPWMTDLKDLQLYLSNDLTVAGVNSAKSMFKKTAKKGVTVQESMDAVLAELNTIAATITPAKVDPTKPPVEEKK